MENLNPNTNIRLMTSKVQMLYYNTYTEAGSVIIVLNPNGTVNETWR